MYQRGAAANGGRHVHGFTHLLEIRTFLKTSLCISIDAVRALHGMRHSQSDEALLPLTESAFGKHRAVPFGEFLPELRSVFADFGKAREILVVIIAGQSITSPDY